ncbi:MAG: multidrug efflux SMR transporter [Spirochaetes bacterium]|nr:multidrug efflux SMR transporter [Spirochaetota bacterium]
MKWIYLSIAIVAEVIATSALRAADGFTRLVPSAIVVAGYGTAFFFLSLTLKTIPLGIAYAVWSGAGITLIALIGYFYYRQSLDIPAIIGIAMIMAGVAIIYLFSKSVSH